MRTCVAEQSYHAEGENSIIKDFDKASMYISSQGVAQCKAVANIATKYFEVHFRKCTSNFSAQGIHWTSTIGIMQHPQIIFTSFVARTVWPHPPGQISFRVELGRRSSGARRPPGLDPPATLALEDLREICSSV